MRPGKLMIDISHDPKSPLKSFLGQPGGSSLVEAD